MPNQVIVVRHYFHLMTFIAIGLIIISISNANGATLKVTRRVVVPIDMDPTDIRLGSDGNYVVTGSIEDKNNGIYLAASAIKLKPDGKLLWRYSSPLIDPRTYPKSTQYYDSSVEMPDGSIFLCGTLLNVPKTGHRIAGVVTHLDKNGKFLDEEIINHKFGQCLRWEDNIVLIDTSSEIKGNNEFSLLVLKENGKRVLDKLVKVPDIEGVKAQGYVNRFFVSNGSLYFLVNEINPLFIGGAPYSEFGKMEVLKVNLDGDIQIHSQEMDFLGAWGKIAKPAITSNRADIYMIGVTKPAEYSSKNPNRLIVKFDANMKEIGRTETNLPTSPVSFQRIFSQSDGSLFYFGSVAKPFSSLPHMGVAYTNYNFGSQAELALVPDDFNDFPYIKAAASAGVINHFITANRLIVKGVYENRKQIIDPARVLLFPPSTSPGIYLVLQFVELTNQ